MPKIQNWTKVKDGKTEIWKNDVVDKKVKVTKKRGNWRFERSGLRFGKKFDTKKKARKSAINWMERNPFEKEQFKSFGWTFGGGDFNTVVIFKTSKGRISITDKGSKVWKRMTSDMSKSRMRNLNRKYKKLNKIVENKGGQVYSILNIGNDIKPFYKQEVNRRSELIEKAVKKEFANDTDIRAKEHKV